jgi:hypothetical protein
VGGPEAFPASGMAELQQKKAEFWSKDYLTRSQV